MSQTKFIIACKGNILQPIALGQIRQKLNSGELAYTDYLWLEAEEAWCMLANYFANEFPAPNIIPNNFAQRSQQNSNSQNETAKVIPAKVQKPQAQSAANSGKTKAAAQELKPYAQDNFAETGISNDAVWFLYRDNEKFGPYSYLELVQLLQAKKCVPDDFVWKPGMADWERIRSVEDFSKAVMEKVAQSNTNNQQVFIQRQFPRFPYEGEVVLHDDQQVTFGEATTISEGGAFVKVSEPNYRKGDRIKLHFSPSAIKEPFNCIAEITQVCREEPKGYCLKFIRLEEEDQKRIADFAQNYPGELKYG